MLLGRDQNNYKPTIWSNRMRHLGWLIAIATLCLSAAFPLTAGAADPLPANNDFILRAPAAEAAAIAGRNGLTIVEQVAGAVDEDGHSIFLMRAASGSAPEDLISDIQTFEPQVAGIEQAVLASLPKLDQSAAMILDTSAVDSALGAIAGFAPPTATVSATWNGHLHNREIQVGDTAELVFEFEQAADPDPASYSFQVNFTDGTSGSHDPANCAVVVSEALTLSGNNGEWQIVNTSPSVVTLDSITAARPGANGDLVEVKLGPTVIYDQAISTSPATITSGWLGDVSKRQVNPGSSMKLELEWANPADPEMANYSLSVTTAEGHTADFAAFGGPCVGHVDDIVTMSGNQVRFDVSNYGSSDLIVETATLTWPATNGKLMLAKLDNNSLLDAPYQEFGKNIDGSDRLVWTGYLNQPATVLLEVDEGNKTFRGDSTVAIIDTGIDPTHALLADRIVPGYDFVNDIPGTASEWPDLDQSAAMILDQSAAMILDQSAAMILDQSAAMILDQSAAMILDTSTIPPAFGHGTMVAGVIHRVAPEASLMPLKVFDANGHAHLYDVVDAIYYAVDNGANVINMSFNLETFSPALMRAINYAARNGVACVASAGNKGEETLVFPAAFGNTLGVASSSNNDELSTFSNWGSDLVTIAAPGENIVTTFPGSRFAVASGTSFAAPWISGAAAVFADKLGTKHAPGLADFYLSSNALSAADEIVGSGSGRAGYGRANLSKAVDRVKSGRYASDRPLGTYTITATFAEGCSANYPPPSTGGGCIVEGAAQLKFHGKRVLWDLTNDSETPITLDSITLHWEADNGNLEKIVLDGNTLADTDVAPSSHTITAGWLGQPEDRVLAPHETVEMKFEFQSNVIWTY